MINLTKGKVTAIICGVIALKQMTDLVDKMSK